MDKLGTFHANQTSEIRGGWYCKTCLSPSEIILMTVPRWCFLCRSFLLFVICVSCQTFLSVPRSFVVPCWERADLLALL